MSAPATAHQRPAWIERAIDTPAFGILLLMASIAIVPVLLLGTLVVAPLAIIATFADPGPGGIAVLALIAAGWAGMIGLARGLRHDAATPTAKIELTELLLVIGLVAALGLSGLLTIEAFGNVRHGAGVEPFALASIAPLLVCIAAALGRLSGLARLKKMQRPYGHDALPLLFLGMALVLVAGALLVIS